LAGVLQRDAQASAGALLNSCPINPPYPSWYSRRVTSADLPEQSAGLTGFSEGGKKTAPTSTASSKTREH